MFSRDLPGDPKGGNFLPTPGFAQLWGNGVWKWLLYTDFQASTRFGDELSRIKNPVVDAREYGDYSGNLNPNLRREGASAASGAL
jgi:hypothetical protein